MKRGFLLPLFWMEPIAMTSSFYSLPWSTSSLTDQRQRQVILNTFAWMQAILGAHNLSKQRGILPIFAPELKRKRKNEPIRISRRVVGS